ncbi:hypothetical protein Y1Q_0018573 [Alligator mississippiensis]|uniref:Uncharacterized protein n=1 Tax=Alligator mississippiensis TaxID=8496 RepID=A0A151PGX2_ALLMI|nr:hypothetical protein Y1Q_0018573 [Alligator mississippiensis]
MTAAGLQIKQVGGLCLEAEELKPVVEDSDRDTNNPLHSTKEEAKQGISRMTNRQELASGQVRQKPTDHAML